MSIAATTRGGALHWNGPPMRLLSCDGTRCAQVVANIRNWQTKVRQPPFRDIAYNHLICPGCGTIHAGRGWGARSAANGTNAANSEWHAWMVLAGEGEPQTDLEKRAILTLHREHARRYGRSRLTTHHAVRGGTTACPGPVRRAWVASGAAPPSTAPPTVHQPPPSTIPPAPADLLEELLAMPAADRRQFIDELVTAIWSRPVREGAPRADVALGRAADHAPIASKAATTLLDQTGATSQVVRGLAAEVVAGIRREAGRPADPSSDEVWVGRLAAGTHTIGQARKALAGK